MLSQDGEVLTWGRGDDGRLGHGDNGWKYIPRITQSLAGQVVVQVTCGSYHTAAVTQNGSLYTWGGGMYGKLGHGNEVGHSTPKRVEALAGIPVSQIACGSRHTAIITSTGALYTWGDKENGVAGHGDAEGGGHQYVPRLLEKLSGKRIVQLSACGFHTACLTSDSELYCWGEGKFGRLGLNNERNAHSPKLVETLVGKKPTQVSCGGFHTAVVCEDGKLYTFGGGEHGQLGHNDRVNKVRPTLVEALEGIFVSQITCGWSHSVALTNNGRVYSWGNGKIIDYDDNIRASIVKSCCCRYVTKPHNLINDTSLKTFICCLFYRLHHSSNFAHQQVIMESSGMDLGGKLVSLR